jgi:uncharacterized protein (TIGR00725 family)
MSVLQIGVIGAGQCSHETALVAEAVGKEIARKGAILVCGGLGGVMEASARGAQRAGGMTIGILPGISSEDANPFITIPIVTGLSHARNVLVVRSSQALIALEGGYGTLSEVAIALTLGKPVIGLDTWDVSGEIIAVETPEDAVKKALYAIDKAR